ncbi:hypothetical protein [Xanthocytophaga flava]|uniref:hypothetical protein n=1 Tax=Xanthocytophaga flava TaxID=3048013 RepID=UPI0028D87443|nr:hypothetical protein [Xanthocytophaga flavus]MDJ1466653.1 hypothetical protein [Xanthocytophaga flavus]
MKYLVIALAFLWLCMACDSSTSETTSSSDTVSAPVEPTLLSRFSPRLQQVVNTESGLIRGFTPGQPLDSVMHQETAVLEEDSIDYKGYLLGNTVNTDTNALDIRYFFNPKTRVTDSLTIDTYEESDSLMKELANYFTVRFGEPVIKEKKLLTWNLNNNQIVIRDVGVKLSPGLQVVARKSPKHH